MPLLTAPVSESGSRFFDPVIMQIVEAVLVKIGARQYLDKSIYVKYSRRAISGTSTDGGINLVRNRADISAELIMNPSQVNWDSQYVPMNAPSFGMAQRYVTETKPIFIDPVAGVSLHELTVPSGIDLTFELQFQTFDAADYVFKGLVANSNGSMVLGCHDIQYSYPVGLNLLELLAYVYKLRTSYDGNDFWSYLQTFATQDFHFDTRRVDMGGQPNPIQQLVVQKQQLSCPGLLEFSQREPEVLYSGKFPSSYKITFTYKVQCGRPNELMINLPVVIENQMVYPDIFSRSSKSALWEVEGYLVNGAFTDVMRSLEREGKSILKCVIPEYDDWTPPVKNMLSGIRGYRNVLQAAFTLDNPPAPTVIKLDEMGVTLHPILKDILSQMTGDDLFGYDGLFNISVYGNDGIMDQSVLLYDPETLSVTINCTITTRRYHIVLWECQKLQYVHPKWYDVIMQYRWYFPLVIARNIQHLINNGFYCVTPDPDIVKLVRSFMKNGIIYKILSKLVADGETNNWIFQYMSSPTFFVDYLTNTPSLNPPDVDITTQTTATLPEIKSCVGRTLMTAFVEAGKSLGYIKKDYVTQGYLRTPKGYPYGKDQGGFNGFVTPLRVLNTTLIAEYGKTV